MRKPTDYARVQVDVSKALKKRLVSFANLRGWTLTYALTQLIEMGMEDKKNDNK